MTVTSVLVATRKLIFGMRDYTVDSDAGTGAFSLLLGTLHACGHVRSNLSPGKDCKMHRSCIFVS